MSFFNWWPSKKTDQADSSSPIIKEESQKEAEASDLRGRRVSYSQENKGWLPWLGSYFYTNGSNLAQENAPESANHSDQENAPSLENRQEKDGEGQENPNGESIQGRESVPSEQPLAAEAKTESVSYTWSMGNAWEKVSKAAGAARSAFNHYMIAPVNFADKILSVEPAPQQEVPASPMQPEGILAKTVGYAANTAPGRAVIRAAVEAEKSLSEAGAALDAGVNNTLAAVTDKTIDGAAYAAEKTGSAAAATKVYVKANMSFTGGPEIVALKEMLVEAAGDDTLLRTLEASLPFIETQVGKLKLPVLGAIGSYKKLGKLLAAQNSFEATVFKAVINIVNETRARKKIPEGEPVRIDDIASMLLGVVNSFSAIEEFKKEYQEIATIQDAVERRKRLAELCQTSMNGKPSLTEEILSIALPHGSQDVIAMPLLQFLAGFGFKWDIVNSKLTTEVLAKVFDELIFDSRKLENIGAENLAQFGRMLSETVEEGIPLFLANEKGSEFAAQLFSEIFSGSGEEIEELKQKWAETFRRISASEEFDLLWKALSIYVGKIFDHAASNLAKTQAAELSIDGFTCGIDIIPFIEKNLNDARAPGLAAAFTPAVVKELCAKLENIQQAIESEKAKEPSESRDARLLGLEQERKLALKEIEESLQPAVAILGPLKDAYRIASIKQNIAEEAKKYFANDDFTTMTHALTQQLIHGLREKTGLDYKTVLEDFPLAGELVDSIINTLSEKIIPRSVFSIYKDVYLAKPLNREEAKEKLKTAFVPILGERLASEPDLIVNRFLEQIEKAAADFLAKKPEKTSEIIKEALSSLKLSEEDADFLQKTLNKFLAQDAALTPEITDFARSVCKDVMVQAAIKGLGDQRARAALYNSANLLLQKDFDEDSRLDFLKEVQAIFHLLLDKEVLETMPIPGKEAIMGLVETEGLPKIAKIVEENIRFNAQEKIDELKVALQDALEENEEGKTYARTIMAITPFVEKLVVKAIHDTVSENAKSDSSDEKTIVFKAIAPFTGKVLELAVEGKAEQANGTEDLGDKAIENIEATTKGALHATLLNVFLNIANKAKEAGNPDIFAFLLEIIHQHRLMLEFQDRIEQIAQDRDSASRKKKMADLCKEAIAQEPALLDKLLAVAMPKGEDDLIAPPALKGLILSVVKDELPNFMGEICDELSQSSSEKLGAAVGGAGLAKFGQIIGDTAEKAAPMVLSNEKGSEQIASLFSKLFTVKTDKLKEVLEAKWADIFQRMGGSDSEGFKMAWEALGAYSSEIFDHVVLHLGVEKKTMLSPGGFACDLGIIDFLKKHQKDKHLADLYDESIHQAGKELRKIEAQIASEKTNPASAKKLKWLRRKRELKIKALEEKLAPVIEGMGEDLAAKYQEKRSAAYLKLVQKNLLSTAKRFFEANEDLKKEYSEKEKQIRETEQRIQEIKSKEPAADEAETECRQLEISYLEEELEENKKSVRELLRPLVETYRKKMGLDKGILLERFPFAGRMLDPLFDELSSEIFPDMLLLAYKDLYLPSLTIDPTKARLKELLEPLFPQKQGEPGTAADYAEKCCEYAASMIDEKAIDYLLENPDAIKGHITQILPELGLSDANITLIQTTLEKLLNEDKTIIPEARAFARTVIKNVMMRAITKTLESKENVQKSILAAIGRLLQPGSTGAANEDEMLKEVAEKLVGLIVDKELLDLIPLPGKEQILEIVKTSALPQILKDVRQDTTAWQREAEENRNELYKLTGNTHLGEACRVISLYVRDFLPYFFMTQGNNLSASLYGVLKELLEKNGVKVESLKYYKIHKDEFKQLITQHMKLLGSSNKNPEVNELYKGLQSYIEAAALKGVLGFIQHMRKVDNLEGMTHKQIAKKRAKRLEQLLKGKSKEGLKTFLEGQKNALPKDKQKDPNLQASLKQFREDSGANALSFAAVVMEKIYMLENPEQLKQREIIDQRLHLIGEMFSDVHQHFAILEEERIKHKKSFAHEVPLKDKLEALKALGPLPAGIPSPDLPEKEQEDIRTNGFFGPIMQSFLKNTGMDEDNLSVWGPLRKPVFELVQKVLLPNAAFAIGKTAVEPNNMDSLFLAVFDAINSSMEESLKTEATTEEGIPKIDTNSLPEEEKILYAQTGKIIKQVVGMIPDKFVNLTMKINAIKDMTDESVGGLLVNMIKDWSNEKIIDKLVADNLHNLHPDIKKGQWVNKGTKDERFVLKNWQGKEEQIKFAFKPEDQEAKEAQAEQNRRNIEEKLPILVHNIFKQIGRSFNNMVNKKIRDWFGRIAHKVKLWVTARIEDVVRPIFTVIKPLAKVVFFPVWKPIQLLWRWYLNSQFDSLRKHICDPANEVLLQRMAQRAAAYYA